MTDDTMKSMGELLGPFRERLDRIDVKRRAFMASGPHEDAYLGHAPTPEQLAKNVRLLPDDGARLHHLPAELDVVLEWAANPSGVLMLSGPTGSGKTYAACAAAFAFATRDRANRVAFSTAADLTDGEFDQMDTRRTQVTTWRFAILDDLGSERGSEFAVKRVMGAVMARWANIEAMPLVVTTNLTLDSLDQAYPEPMVSRLLDVNRSRFVTVAGTDRRTLDEYMPPTDDELFDA